VSGTGGTVPAELTAPAKLTLSLRVVGVRADGYHLLEAEMVTVDLFDTLYVESGSGLTVTASPPGVGTGGGERTVPVGADNLVTRALAVVGRSARVRLVKRIPPGAGLGGGSADAAAILAWAGCTDRSVAVGLGADVPFCLSGGRAVVGGVGELVTPRPYREQWFTLLLPPFGVDTGAVYTAWDRLAADAGPGGGGPVDDGAGANDLEAAATVVEPRLASWRDLFAASTGRPPVLAGSGSTWFVEGRPAELGLADRPSLRMGGETAVLVAVRTTPPRS